jgi:hypothetical protein
LLLLRGVLLEKHPNQAIVETGGVGYDVTIPVPPSLTCRTPAPKSALRIHTHVREDALALYGFLTQDEKALFEKLISSAASARRWRENALRPGRSRSDRHIGAAKSTGWCAFPASARRPPSAWCWNCATSCPRPQRGSRGSRQPPPSFPFRSIRMCFRRCSTWAARARSRSRGAQGQSRGGLHADFEPLFRRALELVR